MKSYNVQIWVGLKNGYSNTVHTIDNVRTICDAWVNEVGDCVTITPTEYRYVKGNEPGVVVGYIQYPRFPRSKKEIRRRALELGRRLMAGLSQYRVTVTTPNKSYMLENDYIKE